MSRLRMVAHPGRSHRDQAEAPAYVGRVALSDNKNIMKARRAIRKALEIQRDGIGFSFVEILSPCPTIWGMDPDPVPARKWLQNR